jgi:hypothetical protein
VPAKKNNPGQPCCAAACDDLCFHVIGCNADIVGATINVFVTGTPGTIIATGTTDANGEKCFALAAYSGSSLSYTVTPPDLTDFQARSGVLIGKWCGRTVEVTLPTAVVAGTPAEGGGTVNVLLTRCDGTTPWSGQLVEIKVSLTVETSGYTDSNGRVTLNVTANGSSAYYIRSYTTAPASQLNSATFVLSAGECADVHMRMTNNILIPCNPDLEAVITERTCTVGTDDAQKLCCSDCFPDTIPRYLDGTDPKGIVPDGSTASNCTFASDTLAFTPSVTGKIWDASRPAFYYSINCTGSGVVLRKVLNAFSLLCRMQGTDGFGLPYTCYLKDTGSAYGPTYDSGDITATSITCDPFSATFDMPAKTWSYYRILGGSYDFGSPCGTLTMAAHTITITE